jgi:tetratricopeptide (TPR) repeat protein
VDNIEWTDALSWGWWQQFLQATPSSGHRLWIILTSTQRFILPETGLDLTVTNLQPLPEAESLSCLASALGLDQGQETWPAEILPVLREGVRHAGGNPLFLRELAFDLLATGTVTYGPEGWRAREQAPGEALVPESLSALLRAKEARLPPAARQTLATAAVIGSRFAWEDMEDLVGREVLPKILQTLVDAGLLAVEGNDVCFRQEALRTLTAASMTEDQRQTVRRQLANRLMARQQEHMEDLNGRIADLLEDGGALDEAAIWAHKAMALATDRQEPGEALRRAHQILRLAKTLPNTAPEELERATRDVASLELQVGSVAEAERLWQALQDTAPIARRHEARMQLALIAGMRGDFDRALAFAEEGIAVAELQGEAGNQVRFLIELGMLATRQERWDVAGSACIRVRGLLPPESQQKDAGDLLVLEGKLHMHAGRPAEALAAGRAALDLYETHRESDAMVEAFQLIASAHRASGSGTQAQRSLRQAMQSARDATVARELGVMLANFALEEGDTPTVLVLGNDWLPAADAGRLGREHLLLGTAWLFAGMRDLLRIHLEGPFDGRPEDLAVLHAIQAISKAESDDMAGARLAVRHALQQATAAEGSTTLARALALGAAGHVAFVAGEYETAVRHLSEARAVLPTPAHPVWSLWFDIVYGISLQTIGSPLPFLPEDLSVRTSKVRLPITLEPYWTMLRSELGSVTKDSLEPFGAWDASMPAWTIGND